MQPTRTFLAVVAFSLTGALCAADAAISTPPPEHPRLYLRAAEVAKLPQRLAYTEEARFSGVGPGWLVSSLPKLCPSKNTVKLFVTANCGDASHSTTASA